MAAASEFRFNNLSPAIQALVFSAFVACLAFVLYTYHLKDLLRERTAIQAEVKKLELSVAEEAAIKNQAEQLKHELSHMEDRFAALKSILSAQDEIPAVLKSVQQMAASSSLKISRLIPKPVIPRSFYSDWPIQMEVAGNYDGLGLFFEKISRTNSIIDIGTFSIKSSEEHTDPTQTLTASCTATVFVIREASMDTFDEIQMQTDSLLKYGGESQ